MTRTTWWTIVALSLAALLACCAACGGPDARSGPVTVAEGATAGDIDTGAETKAQSPTDTDRQGDNVWQAFNPKMLVLPIGLATLLILVPFPKLPWKWELALFGVCVVVIGWGIAIL